MRVCFTGPKTCPPEIGGVEVFSWELAKRAAAQGLDTTVVSAKTRGQSNRERVQNVDIQRIWALRGRRTLKLSMMPGLLRFLRREDPDVVHANDATSGFVSTVGLRRQRTLLTVHGLGFSKADWPTPFRQGIRFLQLRAVRRAAIVVTTDRSTAGQLERYRKDIRVIPPGVSIEMFRRGANARPSGLPEGKKNILFVGRLTSVKGVDLLVESMKLIDPSLRKDIMFTIIGDGPLSNIIPRDASVNWLGELPHEALPPYFANADLLVMPSRSEGLPISLLEAMSSELPVASTLVGGIGTEFGEDYLTAIEKSSPGAVAGAIVKALSDPDGTKRRARAASELVRKKYSWDAISGEYFSLYKSFEW